MFCDQCGTYIFLPEPPEGDSPKGCNCPGMRNSVANFLRLGILNDRVLQLGDCMWRDVPVALEVSQRMYKDIRKQTLQLKRAVQTFREGYWTSDVLLHLPQQPKQFVSFTHAGTSFRLSVGETGRLICVLWRREPHEPSAYISVVSHLDSPGDLALFSVNGTLKQLLHLLVRSF